MRCTCCVSECVKLCVKPLCCVLLLCEIWTFHGPWLSLIASVCSPTQKCAHPHRHVCMHVNGNGFFRKYFLVYSSEFSTYTLHFCMCYLCLYIYTCIRMIHKYIYVYTYIRMIHKYIHTNIHLHTHTHTQTHTHIYIYILHVQRSKFGTSSCILYIHVTYMHRYTYWHA